jgi:hypothetical protein
MVIKRLDRITSKKLDFGLPEGYRLVYYSGIYFSGWIIKKKGWIIWRELFDVTKPYEKGFDWMIGIFTNKQAKEMRILLPYLHKSKYKFKLIDFRKNGRQNKTNLFE